MAASGRFAVHDRRQQVFGAAVLDDARRVAVLRGVIGDAWRLQIDVDRLRDGLGHARDGKRRQAGVRIVGRQRLNGAKPLGQRVRDFAAVPADPDARAVDATAAAVQEHAVGHHVDVRLPVVDAVVAEDDLREPRPVHLHARVALVALDRLASRRKSGCGRTRRPPPRQPPPRLDKSKSLPAECPPEKMLQPRDTASTAPAGPASARARSASG